MPKYICKPPGKKSRAIIARDLKVSSPSYTREYDFVYKRAKGNYIYDVDGRKYLDFSSFIAVMNAGHTNPEVVKAIKKQLKYGLHCAYTDFYAELPLQLEELLSTLTPKSLSKTFLSNSGTEAVEAAYKLARWHSKKKWTIAFDPSFHGRTMGSLSLTNSKPVQRKRFDPFLPVKHVPYPDYYRFKGSNSDCNNNSLNAIEKQFKNLRGKIASIFFEPISGEGGYLVPEKSFVKNLRKLCNKYNVLLVADEVQSGCYRTGEFLAMENYGVVADIVCLSKAIGGGVPLGATIAKSSIMDWESGSHANTFGGNLIACAAGIATLKFLKKSKAGLNAKRRGKEFMKILNELKDENEIIGDVRGLGLMIGVELVKSKKNKIPAVKERQKILCKAVEKGLLLLPAGNSVIRICPPLTISKNQVEQGMEIFEESIKEAL